MRLNQKTVMKRIADEYVFVAVKSCSDSYEGIISATESGALLMQKLNEDTTKDELVSLLCDTYEVTPEQADGDVEKLLQKLRQKGLLIE